MREGERCRGGCCRRKQFHPRGGRRQKEGESAHDVPRRPRGKRKRSEPSQSREYVFDESRELHRDAKVNKLVKRRKEENDKRDQ
jgi:hypothetical protein